MSHAKLSALEPQRHVSKIQVTFHSLDICRQINIEQQLFENGSFGLSAPANFLKIDRSKISPTLTNISSPL